MKQRLGLLIGFVFLIVVLLGLNAATYVQKEKQPDKESSPNRSSFNSGSTGTEAFYSLLSETRHNVSRWQTNFERLRNAQPEGLKTLIIVGTTRKPIQDIEYDQLLGWVERGGTLVYIDRDPPERIRKAIAGWNLSTKRSFLESAWDADPTDVEITKGVVALKPVQPSMYTVGVSAIQTSKLASGLSVIKDGDPAEDAEKKVDEPKPLTPSLTAQNETGDPSQDQAAPPPPAKTIRVQAPTDPHLRVKTMTDQSGSGYGNGPAIYFQNGLGAVLLDSNYGEGRIVFLTDPYVVSNAGISTVDNARLGIALAGAGPTAFDEFHQGFGDNENQLFQYFAGTPVIALFAQLFIVVGAIMFSRSRRFARPVPEPEPDRLTKLEYVSAMAELQNRTEAYDLAVENIYTDFRRRASRAVGVDNMSTDRRTLATLIAERTPHSPTYIEELMRKCEEISQSSGSNRKETIQVVSKLRELEAELGLDRSRKAVGRR